MLASRLADLRSALVLPEDTGDGEAWNEAFFAALEGVTALHDPAAVAPLLLLLDDAYELQDICWAIMHAAERFAETPYIRGLVEAIPTLESASPDWARRLTGSVLNSDAYRAALAKALVRAVPETRSAFVVVFRRLESENAAQFKASVDWMTAAIGNSTSRTQP